MVRAGTPALAAADPGTAGRSRPTTPLTVRTVSSFAEFETLAGPWNDLLARSRYDILFLHHEWLRTWWSVFAEPHWRMRVLLAHEGERLVAAAPLVRKRNPGGLPRDVIEFWANSHTFRTDFVIDRDRDPEPVLEQLWKHLLRTEKGWDLLRLKDLADENGSADLLRAIVSRDAVPASKEELVETPYLPLDRSWDDYFRTRSKNHRKNMRRVMHKLEQNGGWKLAVFADAAAIDEPLERGLEIEGSGWKGAGRSSILSDARTAAFYRGLARRFSALGLVRLFVLKLGGKDAAFDFCINYRGRVYALKTGYDESYAHYSPGQILQMTELQEIFASGESEYDFIGPKMKFKTRWTDHLRRHWTLYVYGRTVRGRALQQLNQRVLPVLRRSRLLRRLKQLRGR